MERVLNEKKPAGRANGLVIVGRILSAIPALMIVAGVVLALVLPVCLSFTDWNMITEPNFIGGENYATLFTRDEAFGCALVNTLWDLLLIGLGGFLLCLLISLLIRTLPRGVKYAVIVLLLTPLVCPGMLGVFARILRGDRIGFLNWWLLQRDVIREPILFLTTPEYAPHIVRGVQLLRSIGPGVLIISAGLDSVRCTVLEESRQRGMRSHFGVFWGITLRRMRLPLMLAAVVMVMGAIGKSWISAQLTGYSSVESGGYTLLQHAQDYGFARYEMGYAATIFFVMQVLVLLAMLVMCGAIFLLTLRPSSWRCRQLPAPQPTAGLTSGWDAWRVLWTVIGAVAAHVLVILPAFLLYMEGNHALMPINELFAYPPRIRVETPTLDNFNDLFILLQKSWVPVWDEVFDAVLSGLLLAVLTAGLIGLVGYGLSHRQSRGICVLLTVILMVVLLCSPVAGSLNLMLPHGYSERIEFAEPLTWTLWAFVPVCLGMGISFGEMRRRKRTVRRLVISGVAYGCLALYLCVRGSLGRYLDQISIGGIARTGVASAGGMLQDSISVLLLIPIVMGAFQMLSGLCDQRPLYCGEEK